MPTYLSPGVYVEEIASGSAPIVGVGTSIAAFIGKIKNQSSKGAEETEQVETDTIRSVEIRNSFTVPQGSGSSEKVTIPKYYLEDYSTDSDPIYSFESLVVREEDEDGNITVSDINLVNASLDNDSLKLTFNKKVPPEAVIEGSVIFKLQPDINLESPKSSSSTYNINKVEGEKVGKGDGRNKLFAISNYVETEVITVKVDGEPTTDFTLLNDEEDKKSQIELDSAPLAGRPITVDYYIKKSVPSGEIKLCTNFSEFKNFFGDFLPPSDDTKGQNTLAHAVYGFFRNGGTRCYVTWITERKKVGSVIEKFEAIDEITIVAAPGNPDLRDDIKDHCEKMGDRVAVLDSEETADLSQPNIVDTLKPFDSNYAALYFPWIQVYDPASDESIYIPPSGHIAGIYARVDGQRGVHKAPANETILGALDLKYNLSSVKQEGLNPKGINCIRKLNGNIRVWGARTLGGDANGEFKYVNIRRQFCYLRDSIDQGTQWIVFEPNDHELWAKIRRNISAFLTNEWRNGALFGTTPQEAFYVKCDEETNPPEVRDLGQVITEIGVAVIKPAEFVIFRLSQWSGSGK